MRWVIGMLGLAVAFVWCIALPEMRRYWAEAVKHRQPSLNSAERAAGLWDYGCLPRPEMRCPACGELTPGKNAYEELCSLVVICMIPTILLVLVLIILPDW